MQEESQNISPALEFITPDTFLRRNAVRLDGQLGKVVELIDFEELPVGMILHTIDRLWSNTTGTEVPDESAPLFSKHPVRKRILFHRLFRQWDNPLVPVPQDKFRPPRGLNKKRIFNFRSRHSGKVLLAEKPEELVGSATIQAMVVYNDLRRHRVIGRLAYARLFNRILAEIINSCQDQPTQQHFIAIPWEDQKFDRNDFLLAYKAHDRRAYRHPLSANFLLLMHLLPFLKHDSNTGMLNHLPEEWWGKITFVFYRGTQAVIYNLAKLKTLVGDQDGRLVKVLNQLNLLAEDASPIAIATQATATPTVAKTATVDDDPAEQIEQETDDELVAVDDENAADVSNAISNVETSPQLKISVGATTGTNTAAYTGQAIPDETKAEFVKEDLVALESAAEDAIIRHPEKTAAQHRRLYDAATAYKHLTITEGGKTIEELVASPTSEPTNPAKLDILVGKIFDESLLSSRSSTLDREYMKKMFEADLAKTLVSFNGRGPVPMFLVGVAIEDEVDALNRVRHFTVTYEDENHQKHPIKFQLPIVDESGVCLVNGTKRRLKKQRVNLPIVKTSPTRVSVATNFNKTIVERTKTIAHSIAPFFVRHAVKAGCALVPGPSDSHDAVPVISFPTVEHDAIRARIADGLTVSTVRVDADFDAFSSYGGTYLRSRLGLFRIVERKSSTVLSDYWHFKELTSDQRDTLAPYPKFLFLRLQPVSEQTVFPYEYWSLAERCRRVYLDEFAPASEALSERVSGFLELGSESLAASANKAMDFCFDYYHRFAGFDNTTVEAIEDLEAEYGVFVGTVDNGKCCFLSLEGTLTIYDLSENAVIRNSTLIDELDRNSDKRLPMLNEYVQLKILDASLPIGMVLSYKFGFKGMLEHLNIPYEELEPGQKSRHPISSVRLSFNDKTIIVPRTPVTSSLIFAGLNVYDLSNFMLADMEAKDPYYEMLEQKGMSTNYLRGIDSFFDMGIDAITKDVLREMGEPTNMRDLMVRAVSLLATPEYEPASSTKNCRIRSYERMLDIVYNEMARGLATYQNRSVGARRKFSINPTAVMKRIMTDQLMENVDTVNPIKEVKDTMTVSHLGDGGRSDKTFMIEDRTFTQDSVGVLAVEATVDSGKVGVIRGLAVDANITNLRGMGVGVDDPGIKGGQMLSVTGVLIPFIDRNDGKRAGFAHNQASHVVGTDDSEMFRVVTGAEMSIAHWVRMPFAQPAANDGTVTKIDEKAGMVEVTYDDGSKSVFEYGDIIASNSGGGFYIKHPVKLNDLEVGKRFNRGDILAYNTQFFEPVRGTTQVAHKLGVTARVAFVEHDLGLEDSTTIDPDFGKRLGFSPIVVRDISVATHSTIHQYVKLGDEVTSVDPLMVFDESVSHESDSGELADLLRELSSTSPKAKHSGTIAKIEVFYKCEVSEMSHSLQGIVKAADVVGKAKANFADGSVNAIEYPEPQPLKATDRVGGLPLDKGTVIIRYHIQQRSEMGAGSKIIVGSALKSVSADVMPGPTIAEDGERIDVIMSARSKQARIVGDPDYSGIIANIMVKTEKLAVKTFFED